MADIQKQFIDFHEIIRRVDDDTLREKREMLIKELREKLPKDTPAFTDFNQGSYAMHTRVAPIEGDDDIDVGLIFDDSAINIGDPVVLKRKIRDAINRKNRDVRIRRPCVTVQYLKDGKPDYHIDLAVYAITSNNARYDLAIGRENSTGSQKYWDTQAPKEVIDKILNAFSDKNEREQYRRCIRDLNDGGIVNIQVTKAQLALRLLVRQNIGFNQSLKCFLELRMIWKQCYIGLRVC